MTAQLLEKSSWNVGLSLTHASWLSSSLGHSFGDFPGLFGNNQQQLVKTLEGFGWSRRILLPFRNILIVANFSLLEFDDDQKWRGAPSWMVYHLVTTINNSITNPHKPIDCISTFFRSSTVCDQIGSCRLFLNTQNKVDYCPYPFYKLWHHSNTGLRR